MLLDGSCSELTVNECGSRGGTPQGFGSTCSGVSCPLPIEACCDGNSQCFELTANDCWASGWCPKGSGTDCSWVHCPPPVGACCFPDGTRVEIYDGDCKAQGGTFYGTGSFCFDVKCSQPGCTGRGDLDRRGAIDAQDIQGFVDCHTGYTLDPFYCACAEVNGDGIDAADIHLFVEAMQLKRPCIGE